MQSEQEKSSPKAEEIDEEVKPLTTGEEEE